MKTVSKTACRRSRRWRSFAFASHGGSNQKTGFAPAAHPGAWTMVSNVLDQEATRRSPTAPMRRAA